jgi:IMP dehydrogenase
MGKTREEFFEGIHNTPPFEHLPYSVIGLRTETMSQIDMQDVNLRGQISTNYSLRNPIIAAAMNCISEDKMAIAMAKVGGAAFIHHANTPEEQQQLAKNVYHHLAGIITNPWHAEATDTVESVLQKLDNSGKDFRTLPVVDENQRCVGLMDKTTFGLFDPSTSISEAMRPLGSFVTGDMGMDPHEVYDQMRQDKAGTIVLLDKERHLGGLCLQADILRVVNSNPEEFSLYENGRLMAFASVPTIPEEALHRIDLLKKYIKVFGIDTSHGEHKYAVETLKAIKENHSDIDVLAGNISTEQTAIEIAKCEPDGMVSGQGPGDICISSDRLGFGTPQASAVYEVSKGARKVNPDMPILADGGIKDSADTVKALACGATAVKVGSLVAGTNETPDSTLDRDDGGNTFRWYWGMGSKRAQQAFSAARARYGHYGPPRKLIFIEGVEKRVPIKGPVADVIEEHVMGVRISMAAQGFSSIEDIHQGARFMYGSNKKS